MFKIHIKRCIKSLHISYPYPTQSPSSIFHDPHIHNYSAGLIKGDKQHNLQIIKNTNQESWILAAPAHNRCTSLVCSCYVASRNSDSKEEESRTANVENRKRPYNVAGGFMESSKAGIVRKINEISNGAEVEVEVEVEGASAPLRSNLKKSASTVEMMSPGGMMIRKVSWSDAHGKDIAHVQEFEPSEEGELAGVGNSCRCAIQ